VKEKNQAALGRRNWKIENGDIMIFTTVLT
jgi:hypothetical protein